MEMEIWRSLETFLILYRFLLKIFETKTRYNFFMEELCVQMFRCVHIISRAAVRLVSDETSDGYA